MPAVAIRDEATGKITAKLGSTHNQDIARHIGVHPSQVSRVLSGKNPPGNQFIAGVVLRFGLRFAFQHVFIVVPS
jgi:hypothetical protein